MEMQRNKKRLTLLGCFVVYAVVNIILLVNNYEAYSIDEFYSLGSANLSVNTTYGYAVYVNGLVRLLSQLCGNSYYIFKMIPLTAGFISYCCIMYIVSKQCYKMSTYWIVSLAVTFNGLILVTHLHIRHYVFAETAYMLGLVFLYKYADDKKCSKIRFVYLVLFVLSNFVYCKFTNDSSATSLMAVVTIVFILILLQDYLEKIFYNKFIWVIAIALLGIIEGSVILIKKQMINYERNPILNKIHGVISFYQEDKFIFVLFLIFAYLAVTIAIAGIVINLLKSRLADKKQVFLTVYIIVPVIAYFLLLFNNSMLRTYAIFMGAGYVLFAYFIDRLDNNIWKKVVICILAINAAFTFYPFPKGIVEFWRDPMMRKEIYIRDYGDWITEVKSAYMEGYTIIPLFTLMDEEYFFDLKVGKSLTLLDEQNNRRFTNEELMEEFETLMNSGDKYVVMADTLGCDTLIELGLFDVLKERYRYTLYDDKWYDVARCVFYIE